MKYLTEEQKNLAHELYDTYHISGDRIRRIKERLVIPNIAELHKKMPYPYSPDTIAMMIVAAIAKGD